MSPRSLFLFSLAVLPFSICTAQPRVVTDSSVIVIPHWKKAEAHSLVIKSSAAEFTDGRSGKSSCRFDARFTVLEKDTSGYTIAWIYTKADVPSDELNIENILLANLLNQQFIFKLSLTGRFKELVNFEEIKSAFDPMIDRLIAGSTQNQIKNIGFKGAKQMAVSRKSLEIMLLKQIKFYNLSLGYKYRTHFVQTQQVVFPNALGGKPFDGTEKVQLTKLDTLTGICVIERSSSMDDTAALKKQIVEYLQKVAGQDSISVQKRFSNVNFELSEKSTQMISYVKGIPQKINFTKVFNFGFEYRSWGLEIETTD